MPKESIDTIRDQAEASSDRSKNRRAITAKQKIAGGLAILAAGFVGTGGLSGNGAPDVAHTPTPTEHTAPAPEGMKAGTPFINSAENGTGNTVLFTDVAEEGEQLDPGERVITELPPEHDSVVREQEEVVTLPEDSATHVR